MTAEARQRLCMEDTWKLSYYLLISQQAHDLFQASDVAFVVCNQGLQLLGLLWGYLHISLHMENGSNHLGQRCGCT